jgi:UV DNA damage repair endonuclease
MGRGRGRAKRCEGWWWIHQKCRYRYHKVSIRIIVHRESQSYAVMLKTRISKGSTQCSTQCDHIAACPLLAVAKSNYFRRSYDISLRRLCSSTIPLQLRSYPQHVPLQPSRPIINHLLQSARIDLRIISSQIHFLNPSKYSTHLSHPQPP